jgi:hypothetical protein
MASFGVLCHVALVRTDVSDELNASFIRVTRIGELGTTLAVTSNRCTLRRNTKCNQVTSQKTPFLIVTTMETSNLTGIYLSFSFLQFEFFCLTLTLEQKVMVSAESSL